VSKPLSSQEELDRFLDKSSSLFEQAFNRYLVARFLKHGNVNDAVLDMTHLLQKTLILSDLYGRKRTLMEADYMEAHPLARFAGLPDRTPLTGKVPFEEAIEDLLSREPRLAKSAAEISRLYNTEHVFSMARSCSLKLTARVEQIIVDLMKGRPTQSPESEILKAAVEEGHNWTRAYASTVYRTNVAGVYVNGHFQQALDPDVAEIIKALEVVGIADERERENHRPARGLIASTKDTIWSRCKPPYGYNCRHNVIFVSRFTLEEKGLLKPNGDVIRYEPPQFHLFRPDDGFNTGAY